jgi:hypothetical protein
MLRMVASPSLGIARLSRAKTVEEDRVGEPEDVDNQISERTDGKVYEVAGHSERKQRKRAPP